MTFAVAAGGDRAALNRGLAGKWMLLLIGGATLEIYLSGGSQTRADDIAFYRDLAREANIGCEVSGRCVVRLGGGGR